MKRKNLSDNDYSNIINADMGSSISPEIGSTIRTSVRTYYTHILGGEKICVINHDLKKERLPTGGMQRFTIKDGKKIYLYLESEVEAIKEILSQTKKQNTSSSTTDPWTNAAANFDFPISPETASFALQPFKKGHEGAPGKKYFLDTSGRIATRVYPKAESELAGGKEKFFTMLNGVRIDLYSPSQIKLLKKILLPNKKQDASSLQQEEREQEKQEKYFTSLSRKSATIQAFPDDVQSKKLPEGEEQFFITVNKKEIYLYTESQVKQARKRIRKLLRLQDRIQAASSFTTSNVNLSSSFTSNPNNSNPTGAEACTTGSGNFTPSGYQAYNSLDTNQIYFNQTTEISNPTEDQEETIDEGQYFDPNNMNLDQQVNLEDLDQDWLSTILAKVPDPQDQATSSFGQNNHNTTTGTPPNDFRESTVSQSNSYFVLFGATQNNQVTDASAKFNINNNNNKQK